MEASIEKQILKARREAMYETIFACFDSIPCITTDEKKRYKVAGWLIKRCLNRPEVVPHLLHKRCAALAGLKDMDAFYGYINTVVKDPATMGELESLAFKETPPPASQSHEPKQIRDFLPKMEGL